MTDRQAAEPPQGTPDRRALGAMESAVRRARESAGGAPVSPPPPQRHPLEPASPGSSPVSDREPDRWLIAAVAVVTVLVVAAAIALGVSLANGTGPRSTATLSSPVTTPGHAGPARPVHHPSATGGGPFAGSTHVTTTTTAPAAVPGAAPVISMLSPSSGIAGASVQVAGSNFLSWNGQIVATFNGQMASTSCPTQNTCTVTVPASSGSPSAQVTITTASGTSNAVTFTYG